MLDFWGVELRADDTLVRSSNFAARYANLNLKGHNYLRITRVIKCVGQLGLKKFQEKIVEFFAKEYKGGQLQNCATSLTEHWIPAVSDSAARSRLDALIHGCSPAAPPARAHSAERGSHELDSTNT